MLWKSLFVEGEEKYMRGKLILIEGTDCSGKETQANKLVEYLNSKGIEVVKFAFPDYESPTGKIVGGPYLGKEYICDGWFSEGAANVDPKVSSLYYAADFLYHLPQMNKVLDEGKWIILDRYFYSTIAHQGCKIKDKRKRLEMYKWFEKLEMDLLELPDPEIKLFLHMPYECSIQLKKDRIERPDQLEADSSHLIAAENAYKEIAKIYNFDTIKCGYGEKPRTIDEIHKDVVKVLKKHI